MAASVKVQTSNVPLPCELHCHVAVTWRNATLVWGGYTTSEHEDTKSNLYLHLSGKWTKQKTHGDFPYRIGCQEAHVQNDTMFALSKTNIGNINVMHSLDLNTWMWTMSTPSGTAPSGSYGISSWAYRGNIYYFGGGIDNPDNNPDMLYVPNNQLVSYNISTDSWEWPDTYGHIPSPRLYHKMIISHDTVFLFGGMELDHENCNDLLFLDLPSMTWKKVHGNMSNGEGPHNTVNITFTSISESTAVVVGSFYNDNTKKGVEDSWLLNLQNAKQLMNLSSIWTRVDIDIHRLHHAAVLQPISKKLWVIGGHNYGSKRDILPNLLKINFLKLAPLKDLALDIVAGNICACDPRLGFDELPRQLRAEIDAYKRENGEETACSCETRGNIVAHP